MRIGIFYQTGLFTDPSGDCCGARPHLEALAKKYNADLIVYAWDDPSSDPAYVDALTHYDVLLVAGHSHGAGEIVKKLERVASKVTNCKLVAGIIDDCPWGNILTPMQGPRPAPAVVLYGAAVWQRNWQPMGRKFNSDDRLITRDMSEYIDGNGIKHKLGHVAGDPTAAFESIAGDVEVWAMIESALVAQLAAVPVPASVDDAARTLAGGPQGGGA